MKSPVLNAIYQAHLKHLPINDFSIVLCGSATKAIKLGSDIDYILIVKQLDAATLTTLTKVRLELENQFVTDTSNTVITIAEVVALHKTVLQLDGKAVQALIEARIHPKRIAGTLPLPKADLPSSLVRDFSRQNFFIIRALVRKQLIRNDQFESPVDHKLVKLCMIALKMLLQYERAAGKTQSVQAKANVKILQQFKDSPSSVQPNQILEIAVGVSGLQPADFAE